MTYWRLIACACAVWMGAVTFEISNTGTSAAAAPQAPVASAPAPTSAAAPGDAAPASPARALVTTYCVSCHNPKRKAGSFIIDPAQADQIASSPETWEKVLLKLRSRAMPPPRSRRPDSHTYDAVSDWLEAELDRAAVANPNPGRPADPRTT